VFLFGSYISIFTQTAYIGNYQYFVYVNITYLLFYYGWKRVAKDQSVETVLQSVKLTTLALLLFLGMNMIGDFTAN